MMLHVEVMKRTWKASERVGKVVQLAVGQSGNAVEECAHKETSEK